MRRGVRGRACQCGSERRLQPQMIETVDRSYVDAPLLAAMRNVDRHGGARAAHGPHFAIEITEALRSVALDAQDDIAATYTGFFRRPAGRDALDHKLSLRVVRRQAEPRSPRSRHA